MIQRGYVLPPTCMYQFLNYLGVSVFLLKREDTQHGAPCGFTCVTMEGTGGSWMENLH